VATFNDRVNEILGSLPLDGTLPSLSERYFGEDYATAAGQFDLASIGQMVA